MDLIKLYFILGLAMFLLVLWDYTLLANTASRLTKPADDNATGFALIVRSIRNQLLMMLFAFFLWPVVLVIELAGNKKR